MHVSAIGDGVCPLVVIVCVDPRWHESPRLKFGSRNWTMCWHLLPRPVIGGQAYRIPPMSTAEWEEKRVLFDGKDWKCVAKCRTKCKIQVHKGICPETIWAVFRGRQVRSPECHPNEGRVLLCHRSDGPDRRLVTIKSGRIQVRSKHVDEFERSYMQWAKRHAESRALHS